MQPLLFNYCLIRGNKYLDMKRISILFLIAIVSFSTALAQSVETRSLGSFSKISVGEAITLILVPGSKNEAKIKAENIDLEDVETDVNGSRLKIGLSGSRHRNIDVTITLTYKSIEAINVSSAADVVTKGTIKAEFLDISVSSAGDADLDINAKEIDVNVSSAGTLSLSGKCLSQRVEVSSAGEYHGYDLVSEEVYAKASSAGSVRVNATKKVDAKASSAGSVKYKGDPAKVYINSNSGGHAGKSH
ncbi:MAG: hypothetical protein DRI71_02140 [Bacteroidetes bacterium]|nr:MAG: hypothetical protein DRI71_02140 [Bacteroidota bacterium]